MSKARKRLSEWSKTEEGRRAYEKVAEKMREFASSQKPIPDDFQKVIDEHFWEMI